MRHGINRAKIKILLKYLESCIHKKKKDCEEKSAAAVIMNIVFFSKVNKIKTLWKFK